ncbi:aminotransferase class III-fold pyridoxal phosphate-dependent enzyme [Amycolatopsis sp. YIM 10]|uniref:aminotransferase class III-fold pyridoxal phosphate-dependent enzyme n=1 Tax=Amycolatopsis sp. YIM 10 TaxID=2653857 RepID=UPI0012903FE0|nr:aminotransferase class III-fold pyridoxal phosphate-dependent enzyme [Amycolatopsis sp. YIM 10]QFU90566.1 4-aminobutyrate aminotransferase GabT [Amycolatopsis sp. YIM 10]
MTATTPVGAPAPEAIVADDRAHVFHPWIAQDHRFGLPVAGAEGSWIWDHSGNRYLDLGSQLMYANLGHRHPKVVAAIKAQAERLCVVAPHFANDKRGEAARLIAERAPGGMDHVLFTSTGGEAVEHAVRMARLHTGRPKLLSAFHSFHGSSTTAIHLTGDPRRWRNDTGAAGVVHFFPPYLYRSAFGAETAEQECERALEHLAQVIELEGAETFAAVVLESIPGVAGGVLVPPDGYLAGVRELCDRHGILLICDEVMVGFGRVGHWFAVDHWGVTPDLITFAKGVNSGYVPLAGVIVSDRVRRTFAQQSYPAGSTYSGHPLACAAAVAAITAMTEEGVLAHATMLGEEVIGPALAEMVATHPSVGEIRGLGAFWAIELVRDGGSGERLMPFDAVSGPSPIAMELYQACIGRGLWPVIHANRVHVAPPCNTGAEELAGGLRLLDEALAVADAHCAG